MPITVGGTTITFNDGTIQSTAGGSPTTAQVLTATAGATFGAVGTYAALMNTANSNISAGSTIAGSSLRYDTGTGGLGNSAGSSSNNYNTSGAGGTALSGTWRKMSHGSLYIPSCGFYQWSTGVFLRIS